MLVIPVIDLLQGQVVRAVRGERQSYRPIASTLCNGSEPVRVARALGAHCATGRLYVADLDALGGRAPQVATLRALLRALPGLELWLDAGFTDAAAARALVAQVDSDAGRIVPVFGSETLRSADALRECFGSPDAGVLSLDRRDGRRLDASGAWDSPERWPKRVIVMTLERVGSGEGPDLETMRALQARSPATEFIGAGGIRDAADLAAARVSGAFAWLVASALHDGRLPRVGD